MTLFYEEIAIGDECVLGSHTFSAEEIIRFAKKYDPQGYHLSEKAAAETQFGRLCASGWHTASVFMKTLIARTQELEAAAQARGAAIAKRGPSPGFEDLKWLKPVFAGDTITYSNVVTGKTESKSRPGWGIVHAANTGVNHQGEPVFFFKSNVFVERRDPAA